MSAPKLLPAEWEILDNIKVHDPDGWRGHLAKRWDEPITREEWDYRSVRSTIEMCPKGITPEMVEQVRRKLQELQEG